MINEETIEKIRESADIVAVVGEYVPLKKRGTKYVACCPFHKEKTASFTVFPVTGTYKCFGCGKQGDAISFLMEQGMTYPEALKDLARRYNIEIEETPLTPEQQQEQDKRQKMLFANDLLQEEYVRQLQLPQNALARKYAYDRWGEAYCLQVGVGYCPSRSKFIEDSTIEEEIVEAMGIRNQAHCDLYEGRVTIPIRNRSNRIIGFTARALSKTDKCKYLNSPNSAIYNKSDSIFGIETAFKAAFQSGQMYLMEGAPDCMRMHIIGVYNAVATLGKEWTEAHFRLLQKCTQHLCFLPDSDPPKQGEEFGAGIKGVMKAGEAAMKFGFSVGIKQIPESEEKEDPDTYFTSMNIFNSVTEVDFVEWLADKLYKPNMNTDEQTTVIHRLAGLLVDIENPTKMELYLDMLVKKGGTKRLWQKAISEQRNARKREQMSEQAKREEGLFRQFGFNIEGNHYYSIGDKGSYEWSNFVMKPLFHIRDAVCPKRLFYLINDFNTKELVELKQEDLVSLQKFKQRIEGLGNFVWLAGDKEMTKLKQYLYENTETATEITQLGWQKDAFYAFGNGVFNNGQFLKVDDYGIVHLGEKGNFYLPAFSKIYIKEPRLFVFERKFIHDPHSSVSLHEFTDQLFKVFGNNGKVAFGFFLASLFHDIVVQETRSFAILNLFGPKGSGKSELGHTLMSFFIADNVPPNIQNSTIAALNDSVAAVANALVHIDEFKNDIDLYKREFLKGLWDGTGRTRKNMDLDKKVVTTAVDCGVILSGQEMATADIALFSRLIYLTFEKSEFTVEEKAEYQKMKRIRSQGMSHLTIQLLALRPKVEQNFPILYQGCYEDVTEALKNDQIEDRILLNWIPPLAMIRTLESVLDTSLTYKEMLGIVINGIKVQNSECRQNNELGAFWNMVQFLVSDGELIEGGDYRIQYCRQFKSSIMTANWSDTHPVLYIQKSRIFMLYKKFGKTVGDSVLPESSLKYYLEKSKSYLGEKPVRFNIYFKGVLQYEPEKSGPGGSLTKQSVTQRSYCFDYNSLKAYFGLNLERNQDETEEEEPRPDPQTKIAFPT